MAHLKRILRLGRLRLRGPRGAQFEFTLAARNLRRLAKLVARPPPLVAGRAPQSAKAGSAGGAGISAVTDCVSAAVAGTAEKRPVTMRITPVGFN